MKVRKITGIVLIVIGAIIFLLALYAKSRVTDAKGKVQQASGFLSDNPVNKRIGDELEKKLASYDNPIMWTLVGGVVVCIVGVGTLMSGKKRR